MFSTLSGAKSRVFYAEWGKVEGTFYAEWGKVEALSTLSGAKSKRFVQVRKVVS